MEDFRGELKALSSLARSIVVESTAVDSESTAVDSRILEDLVSALRHVGYPEKRARERIDRAIAKLASNGEQITEEKILTTAFRAE